MESAKELLRHDITFEQASDGRTLLSLPEVERKMIEFARLHVQETLNTLAGTIGVYLEMSDLLEAYPLENVK